MQATGIPAAGYGAAGTLHPAIPAPTHHHTPVPVAPAVPLRSHTHGHARALARPKRRHLPSTLTTRMPGTTAAPLRSTDPPAVTAVTKTPLPPPPPSSSPMPPGPMSSLLPRGHGSAAQSLVPDGPVTPPESAALRSTAGSSGSEQIACNLQRPKRVWSASSTLAHTRFLEFAD